MLKEAIRYKIVSGIRKEGDKYVAVDVVTFESGRTKEIVRKRGTKEDCEEHAKKLGAYWKSVLTKKPKV